MKAASQQWRIGFAHALWLLPMAFAPAPAFSPVRVATLPGVTGLQMACGDAYRSGRNSIYCTDARTYDTLIAFEYQGKASDGSDSFLRIVVAPTGGYASLFGDGDNDGLMDLVTQQRHHQCISLFEAPDSFSFPTDSVWSAPQPCVANDYRPLWADVDCDGRLELLANIQGDIWIYKCRANNRFDSVAAIDFGLSSDQFATGDFDRDGLPDVVCGDCDPNIYVFEWTGAGDSFALSAICTTATSCNYAVTALGNMDGDTWPAFVVAGQVVGSDWPVEVMVFKASAKHEYHCVWEAMSGTGLLNANCLVSGDVDGDGVNEFVYAHGVASVYKCTGPDQCELIGELDTCPKYVQLYDLTGDGRDEIIIDCIDHVAIYEDTTGLSQLAEAVKQPSRPWRVTARPAIARLGASVFFAGLPEKSELNLYSVSGLLVRKQAVGRSATWTWDLTDQHGRRIPAGTYFAVIRSGTMVTKSKLCVIN